MAPIKKNQVCHKLSTEEWLNNLNLEGQHTIALFNHHCVWVDATAHLCTLISQLENILKGCQCHLDNFSIHYGQKVTEWGDTALVDQEPDLFRCSSRRGIGDRPTRLLPCLEFCLAKYLNQCWKYVGIDDSLSEKKQINNYTMSSF